MLSARLKLLFRLAFSPDVRAATAAACSVAAVLVLTVGLSAAGAVSVGSDEGARRVAAQTHGDLTEAALKALAAHMDPATAMLAKRFDPAAFEAQAPLVGFAQDDPALAELQQAQDAEANRLNAAIPFARDIVAALPFVLNAASPDERERAVRCMTNAIYYEAALEPVDGQRAVAQVVLNRMRNANFPKSICGVVYQGWDRVTGCQFSFTCDGALVRTPIAALWRENRRVAEAALNGYVMPAVGTATHYHADYVSPYWAPTLVKLTKIGAHLFYRWPGQAGAPAAFTEAYAGGELRISEAVLSGKAFRPRPADAPTSILSAAIADAMGARTVTVPDGHGGTQVRVSASFTPAEYGRRQATADEIAHINALLEARYPSKPAETAPAPSEPTAG